MRKFSFVHLLIRITLIAMIVVTLSLCLVYESHANSEDRELVISILRFNNSTDLKSLEPLRNAIAEMISGEMAESNDVVIVEREEIDKILQEQANTLALYNQNEVVRIGNLLGSTAILTGGYILVDDELKINAHLYDVKQGHLIHSVEITGSIKSLQEDCAQLSDKLLKYLKISKSTVPGLPQDTAPTVNLHFIRGLGHFYGNRFNAGLAEFMSAADLDSEFSESRYWIGRCYLEMKESRHAEIEFEKFLKMSPKHDLTKEVKKYLAELKNEK